ncbi:DNA translocase FtsK [Stenotrophomonas acidaminiphila]|uniref:DNA translocase FtsK n=1 Tax=Stenotrophomonas acidaminiphila TaxID=128780 RepID=UPI003CCECD85
MSEADASAQDPAPERDPLYPAALSYVTSTGKASISALQRALKTGYNRAARLIEELEGAGAVSFPDPLSGARLVLAKVVD